MISSQNLVITGGDFVSVQDGGIVDRGARRVFKFLIIKPDHRHIALTLLSSRAVPGALHNSGERYDCPRCHPNTRVAIKDEIMTWLYDEGKEFAMWISGSAGAGKSAICQAIAEMCSQRKLLAGCFFFSRTSTTGRSSAKGIVATIIYQIVTEFPETRSLIADKISKNPLIFELSLEVQLTALIVEPLAEIAQITPRPLPPRLFIIDGLDECDDESAQSQVVRMFVDALRQIQHSFPHKVLFASRPETHLVPTFGTRNILPHLRRIRLGDGWDTDADIRKFLVDSFDDIKQEHPLGRLLDKDWPSPDIINTLVLRSSGQFIYASTVIKYIKLHRHHPVERLKVILGLAKDCKYQAFAELDALYRHILSSAEDSAILAQILCIVLMRFSTFSLIEPLKVAQHLLGLADGMVELHLGALSSVIEIKTRKVLFLHASLPEFLTDEGRAGPFYIYADKDLLSIAKCCFSFHPRESNETDNSWLLLTKCNSQTQTFHWQTSNYCL